jgi:hypothetical protein
MSILSRIADQIEDMDEEERNTWVFLFATLTAMGFLWLMFK